MCVLCNFLREVLRLEKVFDKDTLSFPRSNDYVALTLTGEREIALVPPWGGREGLLLFLRTSSDAEISGKFAWAGRIDDGIAEAWRGGGAATAAAVSGRASEEVRGKFPFFKRKRAVAFVFEFPISLIDCLQLLIFFSLSFPLERESGCVFA